jgi:hypothetical protein
MNFSLSCNNPESGGLSFSVGHCMPPVPHQTAHGKLPECSVVMVEGTVPQHHRNGSLHKIHFLSFYLSMLTAKISSFSYSCRLTNEVQSEAEYVLLLLSKVTQKHF